MDERVEIHMSDEDPPTYIPPRTPREEYDAVFRKRDKKVAAMSSALLVASALRQEIYKLDKELDEAAVRAGLRIRLAKKPETKREII